MFDVGAFWYKSLTMTYFHRCTSTIIGAKAFHGPVRDGKAWDHLAMVVKRKGLRFKGFGLEAPMRLEATVLCMLFCRFDYLVVLLFALRWF